MAWTNPKTWSVGETLTAANFNTHIRDNLNAIGAHYRIRKTTTETVTSSTTLQDDDHLLFAVGASEVWAWQAVIGITDVAAGGFKFTWTAPSGATGGYNWRGPAQIGSQKFGVAFAATTNHTTDNTGDLYDMSGMVVNSTNAGNVTFQWAQVNSSGTPTQILANSFLIAHRIS